jgi:hypothetical protein
MPDPSKTETTTSWPPSASARRRATTALEYLVIAALTTLYLFSFELASPVNGPLEIFGQDSKYIIEGLVEDEPYLFNPQQHVLYHYAVEYGYAAWDLFFEHNVDSVYRFLKLFTALTGLGFLLAMRLLFLDLGLRPLPRTVLLAFTGLSASAWFHFSAFETHGLALPAIALYLLALQRLLRQKSWTWGNRLLLIGALIFCGWTRIDLWRFALLSTPLLALPAVRGHRRRFAIDLSR